jgi:hypothetical protein
MEDIFAKIFEQVVLLRNRVNSEREELLVKIRDAKNLQINDTFIQNLRRDVHIKDAQLRSIKNLAKALILLEEDENLDLTKPIGE